MQLSVTPWTAAHQTSLFFTSPRVCSTHIHWVGDTIQPSHAPLPTSLPTLSLSQHLNLFQKVGSLHQVAKELDSSCSVSPSNECAELISLGIDWFDFLKDWLIWFPCCPRNSQVSSPAPQLKSINSSALNLHYDPTLVSVYDYWKNPSFD